MFAPVEAADSYAVGAWLRLLVFGRSASPPTRLSINQFQRKLPAGVQDRHGPSGYREA